MTDDMNSKQLAWHKRHRTLIIGVGAAVGVCLAGAVFIFLRGGEVIKPAMTINGDPVSLQRYNQLKRMATDAGVKEDSVRQEIVSVLVREHVMKRNDVAIPDMDITESLIQDKVNRHGVDALAPRYVEQGGSITNQNSLPLAHEASEWQRLKAQAELLDGYAALRAIGGKRVTILDFPYENKLNAREDVFEAARVHAEKRAGEVHKKVLQDTSRASGEADKLAVDEELRYGGTSNRSQTVFTDGESAVYTTFGGSEPTEYLMPDVIGAIKGQDKKGVSDIKVRVYDGGDGTEVPYGYFFVVVHEIIKPQPDYPEKIQDQIETARVVLYV